MSWEDEVLEKAYYGHKFDEFVKSYKWDNEPSVDVKIHKNLVAAKEHLDEQWDEWLGYMEKCSEEVYNENFLQDLDTSSPWSILGWFEAYFHSYYESADEALRDEE